MIRICLWFSQKLEIPDSPLGLVIVLITRLTHPHQWSQPANQLFFLEAQVFKLDSFLPQQLLPTLSTLPIATVLLHHRSLPPWLSLQICTGRLHTASYSYLCLFDSQHVTTFPMNLIVPRISHQWYSLDPIIRLTL